MERITHRHKTVASGGLCAVVGVASPAGVQQRLQVLHERPWGFGVPLRDHRQPEKKGAQLSQIPQRHPGKRLAHDCHRGESGHYLGGGGHRTRMGGGGDGDGGMGRVRRCWAGECREAGLCWRPSNHAGLRKERGNLHRHFPGGWELPEGRNKSNQSG